MPPPMKFNQRQQENSEDYYGMVEKLKNYVRKQAPLEATNSHNTSVSSQRQHNRSYHEEPKSILKNPNEPAATAIPWLS